MACSCGNVGSVSGNGTQNRVFLNKIFYEKREDSCPLIYNLLTDEANFTQTLTLGGGNGRSGSCGYGCSCGCGCSGSGNAINCDSRFTVTNSCVTVNSFRLAAAADFNAENVTIDGFNITNLDYEDGRYIADLSGIMPEITRCPCAPVDRHICGGCGTARSCPGTCGSDGHFFLAETDGTWEAMITVVLEGYVTTNGRSCDFKLTCKSRNNTFVAIPGSNNFAVNCAVIPCQVQNISPSILFDFDACGVILNPQITVSDSTSGCEDAINLTINGNLVVTPNIFIQVIRPSLFELNARELAIPCDDVGQCDDYNSLSDNVGGCGCSQSTDSANGCGCSQSSAGESSCSNSSHRSRLSETISGTACQCCDTNGYRF